MQAERYSLWSRSDAATKRCGARGCAQRAFAIFLVLLLGIYSDATAQRVRPEPPAPERRSRGPRGRVFLTDPLLAAFRPAAAEASRATVAVRCDGKDVALGAIVGSDGWIITKASELTTGKITCYHAGRSYDAKLVGVDDDNDIAMLRISARDLSVVRWATTRQADVGQLVAATGAGDGVVAAGVLSVGPRRIPSRHVALGVFLGEARGGVRVLQVSPDSGAARAGIHPDDIIVAIDGKPVSTREQLINIITGRQLGDSVEVVVRRGEQRLTITAILGQRPTTAPTRSDVMNALGGPLSRRNSGFPSVIQHDTVLKPAQCGGPLIDLDGRVIGINIARAGRTESYAVPADVVQSLIPDLKAGKYPARLPEQPQTAPATTRPTSFPRQGGPRP